MNESVVFPVHYFPSIRYFGSMLQLEEKKRIFLEENDNFQKQTYRSRCYILSPNGRQMLNIPISHGHGRLYKDIQIDYNSKWQKEHFRSLEAAYRRSPYFEYYEDHIHQLIFNDEKYLFRKNILILERLLNLLKATVSYSMTESYLFTYQADYRQEFHAKSVVEITPYTQVFSEKFDFVQDLSILDLLFNHGPRSLEYLQNLQIDI
ncbi:MAG: WbqC family protein [Weeksellaceae bacterium]|nr:WbqC family protein [Weeksellaceae bacterium]